MKIFCIPILLVALGLPAAAEVVYLKRSELGAFALGQQIGKGIADATAQIVDARAFSAYRQEGYARLDALRKELAACGSCTDRERLNREVKELQAAQLREDRIMCGTWQALDFNNPSAAAIKKVTGYEEVCNRFNQEAGIVAAEQKNRQNKEEFVRRIKAGDLSAYVWMGRRTFVSNRHLPFVDRANLACPYYAEGARRGVDTAAIFFAQECFGAGEAERREGFEMLKSCATNSANCISELAPYYETTRRTNASWPVAADDREALGLYQQALSLHQKALDQRPNDAQAAGAVNDTAAKIEAVKARLEGRPAASGASVPKSAPAAVGGAASDSAVSAAAGSSSNLVSPGGAGHIGHAKSRDSAAAPSPQPYVSRADFAEASRARVDPRERRCESLLRAVERNQAAAAANPDRYASRLATAQQQYQRVCGG